MVDGLEIDLRLAAAGDAVQQDHARFFRGNFLPHHGERHDLFRVHLVRHGLHDRRMEKRIAVLGAARDGNQIALRQPAPRRRAAPWLNSASQPGPFCWR